MTCAIDLVCLSLQRDRLAVLLAARRGELHVPTMIWSSAVSLEAAAKTLERQTLPRRAQWMEQVKTRAVDGHPLRANLAITYAVAVSGSADANGARWHPVSKLGRNLPACHRAAVADAVAFAAHRAEVSRVAFALLPAEFTLTQLQRAHEAVLGRRLHKANFRRTLSAGSLVVATRRWRSEGRGRPAQLYRRGSVTA